jgi:hypothetical protein
VEPLIAVLLDQDAGLKSLRVVNALGEIGDVRAVEPLIAVLLDQEEGNATVSFKATKVLGEIGDVRAVEPLIAVLLDQDAGLASLGAANALEQISDIKGVKPLIGPLIADIRDESGRIEAREKLIAMLPFMEQPKPPLAMVQDELNEARDAQEKIAAKVLNILTGQDVSKKEITVDAHAMVRMILRSLAEEDKLLKASDLGLSDQAYKKLLESLVEGDMITDFTETMKLTTMGRHIYETSKLMGMDTKGIIKSAADGDLRTVQAFIINGIDVNTKDDGGWTPLILAAQNGHLEIVKLLIENGADINAENAYTETALCLAKAEQHKEIVEILEQLGAKP